MHIGATNTLTTQTSATPTVNKGNVDSKKADSASHSHDNQTSSNVISGTSESVGNNINVKV